MVFIPRMILVALLFCVNFTTGWAAKDVLFPTHFRTEATKFIAGKCDGQKTEIVFYLHKEYQLIEIAPPSHNKYFLVQTKDGLHVFLRYSWWSDKDRIPEEWITSGWIADLRDESPNFLKLILKDGILDIYNSRLADLVEVPTLGKKLKRNSDCRLVSVK